VGDLQPQGSNVDFTVAQMLNQGTIRQKGRNLLSGSFPACRQAGLVLFWTTCPDIFGKQKIV